jgi:hypothetical protein
MTNIIPELRSAHHFEKKMEFECIEGKNSASHLFTFTDYGIK